MDAGTCLWVQGLVYGCRDLFMGALGLEYGCRALSMGAGTFLWVQGCMGAETFLWLQDLSICAGSLLQGVFRQN